MRPSLILPVILVASLLIVVLSVEVFWSWRQNHVYSYHFHDPPITVTTDWCSDKIERVVSVTYGEWGRQISVESNATIEDLFGNRYLLRELTVDKAIALGATHRFEDQLDQGLLFLSSPTVKVDQPSLGLWFAFHDAKLTMACVSPYRTWGREPEVREGDFAFKLLLDPSHDEAYMAGMRFEEVKRRLGRPAKSWTNMKSP